MQKILNFEFTKYKIKQKKIIELYYQYNFENNKKIKFTEKIFLPKKINLENQLVKNLLTAIHLLCGISYYKAYCPAKILHPYKINKEQAEFFNTVYKKGLGEFLYKNKIKPTKIAKFSYSKQTENLPVPIKPLKKSLLGLGGGKDSIVAYELLKQINQPLKPLIIETKHRQSLIRQKILEQIPEKSIKIIRSIDLDNLEKCKNSLNGHIPISAIYASLGILLCALLNYQEFIVANEFSSDFHNIKWKGLYANHQWSKTSEFENMFQNYIKNYISPNLRYFSILRQFYEIRIAKLFSKYPKYFPYFSSCNRFELLNKKTQNQQRPWCCECPKCAFVFLILSPFVSKKNLTKIFGKNLFNQKELLPMFEELLGLKNFKPFECVGTFKEAKTAFILASKKYKNDFIIKKLLAKIKLNQNEINSVFKIVQSKNLPDKYCFLGLENTAIIGFGAEGKITNKYLQQYHKNLKISILDKKLDKNYLQKQNKYEFAVKTPGIPKQKITIPYTTATNIFFSSIRNFTIAVTGSKGKSTTASLIYEILKTAKIKSQLLGNIGKPMLEILLKKHFCSKQIFVIEMSSYQLDDFKYFPNIAVITNLFPDHLDYHQTLENYYNAKFNITKNQTSNHFLVYNGKNKILKQWAKKTKAQSFDFSLINFNYKTNLIGEHNKENIKAAICTAKLLKIPDKYIKQAIQKFKPLKYRLENIGTYKQITFYNDAIATTPEATIQAIKSLPKIGTIFLGGLDRGYDFSELEKLILQKNIKNIVLFPQSGDRIFKNNKNLNILRTNSMKQAVKFAYENTPQNSICLLSTASPSYSLWENFEQKGKEFNKWVKYFSKK